MMLRTKAIWNHNKNTSMHKEVMKFFTRGRKWRIHSEWCSDNVVYKLQPYNKRDSQWSIKIRKKITGTETHS